MGALPAILTILLILPGAAAAATVSVQPFVERPGVDPFESCGRYLNCPPDMVVLTAAAGEANRLTVTEERVGDRRLRVAVRDEILSVQAGAGCEQIDAVTVACTAGTVGPVQLGDGSDRVFATRGDVYGGPGADELEVQSGFMDGGADADVLVGLQGEGGAGDDVLIGLQGAGGAGEDLLVVTTGQGNSGDDVLRCAPQPTFCFLQGGPGGDLITGGASSSDRLFGGPGADRLASRGDSAPRRDHLDCGGGRDRAFADRRDQVMRCERVRAPT